MAAARRQPGSAGDPVRRGGRPLRRLCALPRQSRRLAAVVPGSGPQLLPNRAGGFAGRARSAPRRTGAQLRLRPGGQPREPARRDHAAGAEPAYRPGTAVGDPRPAGRPGRAGRNIGPGARRAVRARRRRSPTSRSRWTTNVPPMSSTCRHFASAGSRSPTANGSSSSTTAVMRNRGGGRRAAGSTAKTRT